MGSLYKDDPDWADVQPIAQDDGPDPVCPIAYTEAFVDAMDYFRAVLHSDERSLRALALTQRIIDLNPANYTAWYYRRLCLAALGDEADWKVELEFCNRVSLAQQKNYQVWHHRQTCVLALRLACGSDAAREALAEADLQHCGQLLGQDSKNYHVWSYRQWAVAEHGAWESEEGFTSSLVEADVRNNSAWNQRFWLGEQQGWWSLDAPQSGERCKAERTWALAQAARAPNNESPWLYLRGMAKKVPDVLDVAELEQLASRWILCVPLRALLLWLHESAGRGDRAKELCQELATQVDTIHAKYWNYKASLLEKKFE